VGRYAKSRIICVNGTLRSALSSVVMSVSLAACSSSATSATSKQLEPSKPDAEKAGVTLVLVAEGGSIGCCRVFTVNPGARVAVFCTLVAIDSSGEIVFSGWIPGPPPGRTRPSGFVAPPGRHGHGIYQLPVDPAHDSYTAPCRPAAWHGGAPI
jgi:hypothetical protein